MKKKILKFGILFLTTLCSFAHAGPVSNPLMQKTYWKTTVKSTHFDLNGKDFTDHQCIGNTPLNFGVVRAEPYPNGGKIIQFYAGFCSGFAQISMQFLNGKIFELDNLNQRLSNEAIGTYDKQSIHYKLSNEVNGNSSMNSLDIQFLSNKKFTFKSESFSQNSQTGENEHKTDEGVVTFLRAQN